MIKWEPCSKRKHAYVTALVFCACAKSYSLDCLIFFVCILIYDIHVCPPKSDRLGGVRFLFLFYETVLMCLLVHVVYPFFVHKRGLV